MSISDLPRHVQDAIKVSSSTRCWLWQKSTTDGYAVTTINAKRWILHRYTYTRFIGDIGEGMVIDHLCRRRNCVNPTHLEPVTIAENIRRGIRASMTHCKRGHEFNEENTYYFKRGMSGQWHRKCRICRSIVSRAKRRAQGKTPRRSKYDSKEKNNV